MPIPFLRCGFATSSSRRLSSTLLVPVGANASTLLDRNARGVTLKVNSKGQAVVSYTARGKKWNVLAWGAVNAIAPSAGSRQVDFRLDYSGGWGTYKKDVWKTVKNSCGTYNGPAARLARDGLHRARTAPTGRSSRGSGCSRTTASRRTPTQSVWELRLSHWTGPLPELTVNTNWAYAQVRPPLRDVPLQRAARCYGFRSTAGGNPLDTFGRNIYVDTFNSAYGPGWKRENSFLMHKGTGAFCYGFYPPRRPPDRQGRALPGHDHRPRRDAGRDVAGQRARAVRSVARQQLADEQRQIVRRRIALCKAV